MSRLIPVIYKNMKYRDIKANIYEVSGNFDKEELFINNFSYSLHTDNALKPRTFGSKIFREPDLDIGKLKSVQKNNIPQLWFNKDWAEQFFTFIEKLIGSNNLPEVLEIHPPFNNYPIFDGCRLSAKKFDYYKAFKIFLKIFDIFYKQFKEKHPNSTTTFLIENMGSNWTGRFLLSKPSDVLDFARILNPNAGLKIVLDYPQIFSSIYISTTGKKKKELQQKGILIDDEILERVILFNQELKDYKDVIGGFHMWGKLNKGDRWIPHAGNFNTLFSNNNELKCKFLESLFLTFNDETARYFVPEVNSGENDLHSIVEDMQNANGKEGFIFI